MSPAKLRSRGGIPAALYPRAQRPGDRSDLYYFEFTDAGGAVIREATMARATWHHWQQQIAAADAAKERKRHEHSQN